jgi:hypothetical protein
VGTTLCTKAQAKLGHNLMALRKRTIFSLSTWYRSQAVVEGVRFVGYKQLQSGDRSVLPALSRTKTSPFLEYRHYMVACLKYVKMPMVVEYFRCGRTPTGKIM